jgi:hypothetical protein
MTIMCEGFGKSIGNFEEGVGPGANSETRLRALGGARAPRKSSGEAFLIGSHAISDKAPQWPGVELRVEVLLELPKVFQQRRFIHTC